jgi:hypothetical protein
MRRERAPSSCESPTYSAAKTRGFARISLCLQPMSVTPSFAVMTGSFVYRLGVEPSGVRVAPPRHDFLRQTTISRDFVCAMIVIRRPSASWAPKSYFMRRIIFAESWRRCRSVARIRSCLKRYQNLELSVGEFPLVQPGGMAKRLLGFGPLVDHVVSD